MRFEYYHSGLDYVPKLSVDGTVANSVHFSHWQGNETPAEVKADTSTETSNVIEFSDAGLTLVTLAPQVFSSNGFDPTRHAAPCTVISRYAKGRLFLITTPLKGGWAYRIDYPYYSWAETIVRPGVERHDFSELLDQLNQSETRTDGRWKLDNSEMTSAIKFLDSNGRLTASMLPPDEVAGVFRNALLAQHPARTPHA